MTLKNHFDKHIKYFIQLSYTKKKNNNHENILCLLLELHEARVS